MRGQSRAVKLVGNPKANPWRTYLASPARKLVSLILQPILAVRSRRYTSPADSKPHRALVFDLWCIAHIKQLCQGDVVVTIADQAQFAAMRQAMVSNQLRTNAVSDPRLVAVMGRVPREAFLPAPVAGLAYRDTALPLGAGRAANVPIATGRLLNEAAVLPTDHVLLIGAAGGYTAAVLAEMAAMVVAVESDAALVAIAQTALAGNSRIQIVNGPLEQGHAAGAPYDVVVIDGAVPQVPQALIDQLAIGGRLVTGIIDRGVTRLAAGRRSTGGFGLVDFADVDCVGLPGFALPRQFVF